VIDQFLECRLGYPKHVAMMNASYNHELGLTGIAINIREIKRPRNKGLSLGAIFDLLGSFKEVKFSYIRRSKNLCSNKLARRKIFLDRKNYTRS